MTSLDSWRVTSNSAPIVSAAVAAPAKQKSDRSFLLTVATSVAAVALAFLAGQSLASNRQIDVAAVKAELRAQLRQELFASLRSEVSSMVVAEIGKNRPDRTDLLPLIESESDRIVNATLAKWERNDSTERQKLQEMLSGILGNQVALRTDLENLAIEAEAQIIRTRRELLRLSIPQEGTPSPKNPANTENGPMLNPGLKGSSL